MLLTEQTLLRSGDRYENVTIQIAPDIEYKGLGGGFLVAPEPVNDVVFRNVTVESSWALPEHAPFYGDLLQFRGGGNDLRFENVTIKGAPRNGLEIRGTTERLLIRNVRGERCFSLIGIHFGPHRCARLQNIVGWNGWIHQEKQPDHDNGPSELYPGRRNGWSVLSAHGLEVGSVEGVMAWGECAGFKLTHCKHVTARHFAVPNLMVQESDHIVVEDGVADRTLSARTTRAFHPVQLSHPSRDVKIRNLRVQNDGRARYAFQSAHGMYAKVSDCAVFGWDEDHVSSIYDDKSKLMWCATNQVFP
jgi:hypothetical protein